jgi:hypothetical protein
MIRNVVINHPNAWECHVYRKVINRSDEPMSGGIPTIGGMGVISSDDEEDISWELVGIGYALQVEPFQPSVMMDRVDANNGFENEIRYLVEPEEPSGMPGYFEIRKNYVIQIIISDNVKLAHEIVNIETVSNIPPFVTRYVTNRRADLDII